MLTVVPGKPFFFTAPVGAPIEVVAVSHKAGPNEPAFRYAAEDLDLIDIDIGNGETLPGAAFTVVSGRRRLGAVAPFLTNPPKGEFFFYECVTAGQNVSLVLLGSVLPDDPTIAWTIEGV